jgi:hypothetical protein
MQEEPVDAEIVHEETAEELPQEPSSVEVAVRESTGGVTLFGTTNPREVIEAASAVASVLTDVLKKQGLTTRISGRDHVRVEGWQTTGSMLGVFPVLESVETIPWPDNIPENLQGIAAQGKSFGFVARYRAQRADGAIVGGGEAECRRTESTWKSRDDFALKSMAQTRATSKALKAPLGFVVALAGYATTPAEELGEDAHPSTRGQEPYGRQASPDSIAGMGRAVQFLGVPADKCLALFDVISRDASGYMPDVAARAVMRVAAAVRDEQKPQQEPEPEKEPEQEAVKPPDHTDQEELALDTAEPADNPGGYPD